VVKRNLIKICLWLIIGSLIVFLSVACGSAAASEENRIPETAVPTQNAQVAVTQIPAPLVPTATPSAPATPTIQPTMTATAVIEPTRPLPTFQNSAQPEFVQAAENASVPLIVIDESNTGVWQYPEDTFIHPMAFVLEGDRAYLIDAGQVLALDMAQPAQAEIMLRGGDVIEDVTVIEPLDLYVAPDGLLVLDRAGDVYRFDWQSGNWMLDRYDRPISDTSSHYYVALAGVDNAGTEHGRSGRYLLETSYNFALLYENGERVSLWNLPEARGIDMSAVGESVYVLEQDMVDTEASLNLYKLTSKVDGFRPNFVMNQARQVVATETAVYVLDQAGQRLLMLSPQSGQLQTIFQLPQDDTISAFAIEYETGSIHLAGRNRLYFYEQSDKLANVPGLPLIVGRQPHDPRLLASISGFIPPIGWEITTRDLQMPGAPRHYRLGVHQGSDFYWARDSQVFAAADGIVIRAMHDYVPPFPAAFYEMRNQSHELGYTSEEALDFYRGRQVWIEHENGVVSRYIHLADIAWDIEEGQLVSQGQFIGTVGNSGSPASLESPDSDAHLHFELWLGDNYVGQFLRPIETRDWITRILHN
jgi:murein DD-endopeptidase MepM/ murein hydrolase activator NlpD